MVNLAWSFFQPRWDVKSRENDLSSPQSCFFVASQSVLNHMQPCKHDIYVLCSLGIKEIRILWLRELWGVSSVIKGLSQWFGNYGDKTKLNAPQNGIKAMMRTRLRLVWRSATRLPDYYGLKAESAAAWRINMGMIPKTQRKTTRIFKWETQMQLMIRLHWINFPNFFFWSETFLSDVVNRAENTRKAGRAWRMACWLRWDEKKKKKSCAHFKRQRWFFRGTSPSGSCLKPWESRCMWMKVKEPMKI